MWSQSLRIVFAILITVFWASMMGLLLQREIFHEPPPEETFASAPAEAYQRSKTRMGIYRDGNRIGASDTQVIPLRSGAVNIINVTNMETPLLKRKKFAIRLSIQLDSAHCMKQFRMDVQSPIFKTSVRGRVLGEQLEITTELPQRDIKQVIPYNSQTIVSSVLTPLAVMPRLEVGKTWRLKAWNPMNMQQEDVAVKVEAKTWLRWQGKDVETYLLEIAHANLKCKAWIGLDGELLQEEVPLGVFTLTLKKEEIPAEDDRDRRTDKAVR